jgi:hypothetical protein
MAAARKIEVENPGGTGVFVKGHGAVAPGTAARVEETDQVKRLLESGALRYQSESTSEGGN